MAVEHTSNEEGGEQSPYLVQAVNILASRVLRATLHTCKEFVTAAL